MPTTVHIPEPLLSEIDKKAQELKLTRNRYIIQVLKKALAEERDWPPSFFDMLKSISRGDVAALDEMDVAIQRSRRSKKGPPF